MSVLRSISELLKVAFWWHRAEARSNAVDLEHTPIHKLPPELILLIIDYLSVESGASLSLTCYSLYSYFGKQCLESLKEAEYSTINRFLHFLERDLRTHIVCPHCNQLHSISSAKEYHLLSQRYTRNNKPWLACWEADHKNSLESGVYIGFSSTILRMAMKAYRQGHEITELLGLLRYGPTLLVNRGFVEQRTVAVRIQNGSLLARDQRVFMVSSSQKVPLPWCGSIYICPHRRFASMTSLYMYGIEIPHGDKIEGYENRQGLIYCEHCYTSFRVDFKSYGKAGNAMFLTRWINVGEGRDQDDHKFRSRLGSIGGISWTKVTFRRGSICAAFEQKAASKFKFDSLLTQQNEKDLCTANHWPWPEGSEVSDTGQRQYYVVRRGRFLLL